MHVCLTTRLLEANEKTPLISSFSNIIIVAVTLLPSVTPPVGLDSVIVKDYK